MNNTQDSDHSLAYREETRRLADVVAYIEQESIRLEGQTPGAAHKDAAVAIQAILRGQSDNLRSALAQPYFGRLDYHHRDADTGEAEPCGPPEPPRTIYLGTTFIPGKNVFTWTAPVGRLWYTQSHEDGYTAPKGYIPTRVDLKRYLKIRDSALHDLTDIFRRQLPAPESARRDVLAEALGESGDNGQHLQVIVETIEPEQYENIANVSDRVLIVQGAAGSGKSEIGLHRIAYLLSPFNDITPLERPTPETTLFVGPSQAFLDYAADLLPDLGINQGVERVRFSDWLRGRLSQLPRVEARIWASLIAPGDAVRFNAEAEAFKGSLAMADALRRHVAEKTMEARRQLLLLAPPLDLESGARLTPAQVRLEVAAALPPRGDIPSPNRRRERFLVRIVDLLWAAGQKDQQRPTLDMFDTRGQIRSRTVEPWCDRAWRDLDFQEEYVALLSAPSELARLAQGGLTETLGQSLASSSEQIAGRASFDDSDVGALAYLDHLLNGTIQPRYRHVVVDEAQDISPIEFLCLAASSSNNWFTVLGDTAQRLTPYRGVGRWRDLDRVFGRSDIAVQRARKSYRSNLHITRFNNRILRTFDENIPAPIPFDRDGHRVEFHQYRRRDEMYEGIAQELDRVRALDGLDGAIIAVLARDSANLNGLLDQCRQIGADGVAVIQQEGHESAPTLLGRIHDVKGLEFDAVIVMGVNDSFSDTVFNKKLLYLATTRAKHYLAVHWAGAQSPILKAVSDRGVVWG